MTASAPEFRRGPDSRHVDAPAHRHEAGTPRDDAIEPIRRLFDAVRAQFTACDDTRTLIVDGPPGCGRTYLLDAVSAWTRRAGAPTVRIDATGAAHLDAEPNAGGAHGHAPQPPAHPVNGPIATVLDAATSSRPATADLAERSSTNPGDAGVPTVVICDDAHRLPRAAVTALSRALHTDPDRPVLVVASTWVQWPDLDADVCMDLLSLPRPQTLRLPRPARREMPVILQRRRVEGSTPSDLDAWWAATRGNMTFLSALVADFHLSTGVDAAPRFGAAFGKALTATVQRLGSAALTVADHLALCPWLPATGRGLAAVAGLGPDDAQAGLDALHTAGIATEGRFHADASPAQLIAEMDSERRRELCGELAGRLHRLRHEARGIADVILRGPVVEPWARTVLREAAVSALAARQPARAVGYLEAALLIEGPDDPDLDREILADLHADALALMTESARQQPEEQVRLVESVPSPPSTPAGPQPTRSAAETRPLPEGPLLEALFPDAASALTDEDPADSTDREPDPFGHVDLARAVRRVVSGTSDADVLQRLHRYTVTTELTADTVDAHASAIYALVLAGRSDLAAPPCGLLRSRAEQRGDARAAAVFGTLTADITVRLGRAIAIGPDAARELAEMAETPGEPIAHLAQATRIALCALTADDDLGQALLTATDQIRGRWSVFTPALLQARGELLLASGHPDRARVEFERCRQLLATWGTDFPHTAAWRLGLAESLFALGDVQSARELLEEQRRTGPAHGPVYVRLLRDMARDTDSPDKASLLRAALAEADRLGDVLAGAGLLLDLSREFVGTGRTARGRLAAGRSWQLARHYGAQRLCDEAMALHPRLNPSQDSSVLSRAEVRTLELVMRGFSNREIAESLHLTVSTVEQHLSRSYRKLGVPTSAEVPLLGEN